jgi:hypothetical protein
MILLIRISYLVTQNYLSFPGLPERRPEKMVPITKRIGMDSRFRGNDPPAMLCIALRAGNHAKRRGKPRKAGGENYYFFAGEFFKNIGI